MSWQDTPRSDRISIDNTRNEGIEKSVPERGLLITFEGTDGSGKSTQIKELRRRILAAGKAVHLTYEPGGTVVGEAVRKLVKHTPEASAITPEAELLLFAASRAQLVREVIQPKLAAGEHVIADRFLDSTTVYQGMARPLNLRKVRQINEFAVDQTLPDITFLLDMDSALALSRVRSRGAGDRMDKLEPKFYETVIKGYLKIARKEKERFAVIDATQSVGKTSDDIWDTLTGRFDGVFS
ncbi:MAG: dTMP kinase [Verrucomicrobiota bacterium]